MNVSQVLTGAQIDRGWQVWEEGDDFLYLKKDGRQVAVFSQWGAIAPAIQEVIRQYDPKFGRCSP